MIKILHRYILKEFIGSFVFGLIIFSAILLLDQIFQLVDLFLSKGVSLGISIRAVSPRFSWLISIRLS